MQDFIERLRARPEHVRKQIALGTAGVITGVVALGWMTALLAGGTLALHDTSEQLADDGLERLAGDTQSGLDSLMAGAAEFAGASTSEPKLNIIESNTSSTLDRNKQEAETRTVIPF